MRRENWPCQDPNTHPHLNVRSQVAENSSTAPHASAESMGHADALRLAAHTFKGSAALFESPRTTAAVQQLESFATQPDFGEAQAVILQVADEVNRLASALAARTMRLKT